jgi:hypothetical protein
MIGHGHTSRVAARDLAVEGNAWSGLSRIRAHGRFCGRDRRRCYAGRGEQHLHHLFEGGFRIETFLYYAFERLALAIV